MLKNKKSILEFFAKDNFDQASDEKNAIKFAKFRVPMPI